jgi:hypothetical protein
MLHEKESELEAAYLEWVRHAPVDKCCKRDHVRLVSQYTRLHQGEIKMDRVPVQLPDSQVCERERAWRRYISVRDGRNYYVPD